MTTSTTIIISISRRASAIYATQPLRGRAAWQDAMKAAGAEYRAAKNAPVAPARPTVEIELGWHKANDRHAATYKQIDFIDGMLADAGIERPWSSTSNAQRRLDKFAASELIDALKAGNMVVFA